ncbi:hypothetical protein AB0485_003590 [Vibrio parahaemolyticus]
MSIKKGVIASVVAGVILMIVPKPETWVEHLSGWVTHTKVFLSGIFLDEYALAGWQWLLILPLLVTGFVGLLGKLVNLKPLPEHYEYTEDTIRNAKWRWSWSNNQIKNLSCYCPVCDCALVYSESDVRSHLYGNPYTKFYCESCNDNEVSCIEGGDMRYAYSLIEREIDRRVRKQEYKKY